MTRDRGREHRGQGGRRDGKPRGRQATATRNDTGCAPGTVTLTPLFDVRRGTHDDP